MTWKKFAEYTVWTQGQDEALSQIYTLQYGFATLERPSSQITKQNPKSFHHLKFK